MQQKLCNVCKVEKPVSEFYKKGSGYQYRCKECVKKKNAMDRYDLCECGSKKMKTSKTCTACRNNNMREIYSEELINQVCDLYSQGKSTWKIADILGTHQQRVYRLLARKGVTLRENSFVNDGSRYREENPRWSGYKGISGSQFGSIKRAAKLRDITFEITIEQLWDLFVKQDGKCALSGLELILSKTDEERINGGTTASLDRIDSNKAYTINNVQWVHKMVNRMKSNFSENDFLYLCSLICKTSGDKIPENGKLNTLLMKRWKT